MCGNNTGSTHGDIRTLVRPVSIFAVSRLGLFLLVFLSLIFIPVREGPGLWRAFPRYLILDGWARWDSGWFCKIATEGYDNVRNERGQDTAIFPLYPLLIRGGCVLLRNDRLAGIVVANAAFLGALVVLFRLASALHGVETAQRTIVLLAFSPFSFFSAAYSESVFLLAVVCAFYFGERRQWLWASLFAAAAGATRVVGMFTVVGLALLYMEQRKFNLREVRLDALWLLLCLAGPAAHMIFLWCRYGNPLQFVASQSAWDTLNPVASLVGFLRSWRSFGAAAAGQIPALNTIHLLVAALSLALPLLALGKVRLTYVVWSELAILVSLSRWVGMGRHSLVVFPLFIMAALLLKREWLYQCVLSVSILLLALFSIMFSHWYWVG